MFRFRIDGLTLVAVLFMGFFGFNILRDAFSIGHDNVARPGQVAYAAAPSAGGPQSDIQADLTSGQEAAPSEAGSQGVAYVIQELMTPVAPSVGEAPPAARAQGPAAAPAAVSPANITLEDVPGDPEKIVFPYTDFVVTQGVHGAEYGQMAVDIAAGKGAPVKSPINGKVTALYVDEYGNPVLVLENIRYSIMLYHGQFSVKVGDTVAIGSTVGLESNQGYTVDGFGQVCTGRDCGYHTHINVYDKQKASNVNPLEVLQPLTP